MAVKPVNFVYKVSALREGKVVPSVSKDKLADARRAYERATNQKAKSK